MAMQYSFTAVRRKGKRPPKSIGGRIDHAKLLDQDIKDAERVIASWKSTLEEEKVDLRHDLEAQKLDSGKGQAAIAIIKRNVVPTIDDYDKVVDWVKKNDAQDLFQRRISSTAWRDRAADGQVIPGIGTFTRVTLELRVRRDGDASKK